MCKVSIQFAGSRIIGAGSVLLRREYPKLTLWSVIRNSDNRPPTQTFDAPIDSLVSGTRGRVLTAILPVLRICTRPKIGADTIESVPVPMIHFNRTVRNAKNESVEHYGLSARGLAIEAVESIDRVFSRRSNPRAKGGDSLIVLIVNNRSVTFGNFDFTHKSKILAYLGETCQVA